MEVLLFMDKQKTLRYVKISVTLGCFAAGSALLISLVNLFTADIIYQNANAAKLAAIKEIYGENVTYGKEIIIEDADFKYLDSYFSVTDQNNQIGTVFITSGSNAYGNINMAIGINYDESGTLGVMKLIENGQSFASTLQSNYVDKYNNGEIGIYDTSCGATYGAILIKDMALQAQEYFVEKIGFMPVDLNEQEVR